jgi:hypothetical protein
MPNDSRYEPYDTRHAARMASLMIHRAVVVFIDMFDTRTLHCGAYIAA